MTTMPTPDPTPDVTGLAETRRDLTTRIKALEAEKARIDERLRAVLTELGISKLDTDGGLRVQLVTGSRESLSERKLLELGVSLAVLEKAKVASTYTSLRIDEIK